MLGEKFFKCFIVCVIVKASPDPEDYDGVWETVWDNGDERRDDEWCYWWCHGRWRWWRGKVSYLEVNWLNVTIWNTVDSFIFVGINFHE